MDTGGVRRRAVVFVCRWLSIAVMSAAVLVLARSGPAAASCVASAPLEQAVATAPVVFVGTVTTTSNGDWTAQVRVESVWKGPSLPHAVEVQGSFAAGPGVLTTLDTHFQVGQQYLFVPPGDQHGPTFLGNACSPTIEYSGAVARYAPEVPKAPERPAVPKDSHKDSDFMVWLGVTVAAVALGVAIALVVVARRRRARTSRV